jgi:hypothetical protein
MSLCDRQNIISIGIILYLQNELANYDIPTLSERESESIEGEITLIEASNTLRKMKSNKSLGSDGFSSEFFKVFLEIYWCLCCSIY